MYKRFSYNTIFIKDDTVVDLGYETMVDSPAPFFCCYFLNFSFLDYLLKIYYLFLFLAVLGLRCFTQASSRCGEQGLLSRCGLWASHCSGYSLQSMASRAHRPMGSVVHNMWDFPGLGIEPMSPALAADS